MTKPDDRTQYSRYNEVCLVLDGEDYDCTTKKSGQGGLVIKWKMPTRLVKVMKIDFRDSEPAQIANLKIHYYEIDTVEQKYLYDMAQAYQPSLPVIASFNEKQLWIEISDKDAEDKLQKEKDKGDELTAQGPGELGRGYWDVEAGMWLDVITKQSSEKEIKRHREVLTTRNNKSKSK